MKKYTVGIQSAELKNISRDDCRLFAVDKESLRKKFEHECYDTNGEAVEWEESFDDLDEARKKYDEILSTEYSSYLWGNKLLELRRAYISEDEVDEEGDFLNFDGWIESEWLEINGYPTRSEIEIKTYPSNWDISWTFKDGTSDGISIDTDGDNINSDIYDDVEDLVNDVIEKLEERDCVLSENERNELESMCQRYFSERLKPEVAIDDDER